MAKEPARTPHLLRRLEIEIEIEIVFEREAVGNADNHGNDRG
jgi:hypothetical protein